MAITIWTPFQRLDAADLNAAFEHVRPRAAHAQRSTTLALSAGAYTDVPMTAISGPDPDGMLQTVGAVGLGLVLPVAGVWMLYASAALSGATTAVTLNWSLNGTAAATTRVQPFANPAANTWCRGTIWFSLNAGTTVILNVMSASAGTLAFAYVGASLVQRS